MAALDPIAAPSSVPGPSGTCCVDYAYVVDCDGVTDTYRCPFCEAVFTQSCPDTDLWNPPAVQP